MSESTATAVGAPPEVRSWGWHLLQVSSWLLLVLLPLHLIAVWLVHDAGQVGVAFYVERWHSGTWRILDWMFFMLALAHGGIGLNGVLGSLTADRRLRMAITIVLGVGFGGLALSLSATIFAFEVG